MPDEAPIVELLVAFGHELRTAGLVVGSGDVMTYCAAVASLDASDLADLYWAGRTTLVTRREQIPDYDRVFRRFFLDDGDSPQDSVARNDQSSDTDAVGSGDSCDRAGWPTDRRRGRGQPRTHGI